GPGAPEYEERRSAVSGSVPGVLGAAVSDEDAVAAVLHQIRSGVRQRQAEIATLQGGEEVKLRLLELKTLEYLDEPIAFSPRPVTGKLLVFVRKAVFHLFLKW